MAQRSQAGSIAGIDPELHREAEVYAGDTKEHGTHDAREKEDF
jgi:hypothetical protein